MTLVLNNQDVESVLTMEITMNALERAYIELAQREAICRPRIDIQIPTKDPEKISQGHHGRRLHVRLFCHPNEIGRDLRVAIAGYPGLKDF